MPPVHQTTMEHIGTAPQLRAQINQIWNVIVSQLGYWNTDKTAAIDKYEFRNLFKEGQVAVLNEFAKFLGGLASVAYTHNLAIFGPKTIIESERFKAMFPDAVQEDVDYNVQILVNNLDTNRVNNLDTNGTATSNTAGKVRSIFEDAANAAEKAYIARFLGEDFLAKHHIDEDEHGTAGRGPRRPPNAFILYRKDKALQIKESYPNIHNNEISVMVGALWHNEIDEIRQAYSLASKHLKARFHEMHPNYRYNPRRPSEIQRRATRNTQPELANVLGSDANNREVRYRRRAKLPATIRFSTINPTEVAHSLPMNVQDAIYTRFPGVTNVYRGPVQTAVVQDLPFLAEPITTFIDNDNLRDLVVAHGIANGSISPTPETMLGSLSLNDIPGKAGADTEQAEVPNQAWEFPQTHMDEFVDFNAAH